MPKVAKELSPLDVKRLRHPGGKGNAVFTVGGVSGLLIQITPKEGRTWLLRVMVGNKRREIGLGGFPDVSLAQARERAREIKEKIRNGIDPVEERKAVRSALIAAQRRGLIFKDAVDRALPAKVGAFKNEKHIQQWRSTLDIYALPELGQMTVAEITVQDVLRVLQPIWETKTTTAKRLRGRMESVLSWATVAGHRAGDNPARWAGNLKELLPPPNKLIKKENFPAVPISDAPRWIAEARNREGFAARALEFLTLTAARSGEVRGAVWDEIDLDAGVWIIPAERMKMDREHRVPLSVPALELLRALPRMAGSPFVFPSARGNQLSDMTLSGTMRRMNKADIDAGGPGYLDRVSKRPAVPHGMRSTFRDWVAERTHFPGEMAEIALAHKVANAVEAAYRRGDMVEKRRSMMDEWANFLAGKSNDGKIVQMVRK